MVDEKDFKGQDITCSHETSPKAKNKKNEIVLFPINIHFTKVVHIHLILHQMPFEKNAIF